MENIIYGKLDNTLTTFPNSREEIPASLDLANDIESPKDLAEANYQSLFKTETINVDVTMDNNNSTVVQESPDKIDNIFSSLKEKLKINPKHLKISLLTSKVYF